MSELSLYLNIFEKMSFESMDIICSVSSDNNVINIDHKKDTATDGGMEEENKVICFTSSHIKLYQDRAKATKPST